LPFGEGFLSTKYGLSKDAPEGENMREEKLIAEIIGQANGLNDNLQDALAEYLNSQAKYNYALAERKELEVHAIKNAPPEPEPIPKKVPKKVGSDMPW
jgi:hypothetical protein